MTTPKAKFAGLALIAALCAGFTLGLTAPAWAGWDEGLAAYQRGDYATALLEWHPLAEQGGANAQLLLGSMYDNGRGVPQDDAEAVRWYRKAAEQGYARAQRALGIMYRYGYGVAKDFVLAHMWYNLAAAQGNFGSGWERGVVAMKMTPAQISKAQKLAREWRPKK